MHENSLKNLIPWKPGQTGNVHGLGGRPKGSRERFSRAFLADLADVWAQEGKQTMEHCATTNPDVFFATCSRLIPNDVGRRFNRIPGNFQGIGQRCVRSSRQ